MSHSTLYIFTFVGLQFAMMIWRSSSKNCTIGVSRAWSVPFEITYKILYNRKTKSENNKTSPWKNTSILWAWYSFEKPSLCNRSEQNADCRLGAKCRLQTKCNMQSEKKTSFSLSPSLANRSECSKELLNFFSLIDVNSSKTTEAINNLLHEVQLNVLRRH